MATVAEILKGQGETLICHSHLMQMLTFTRGGGVEFLPAMDEADIRKIFLDNLVKDNRLLIKQRAMVIRMIKDGRFLLYLRPNGSSYRIENYPKSAYRAYTNADGDLDSVVIIYSYKFKQSGSQPRDRWIRLRITSTTIEKSESDSKPDFEQETAPDTAPMPNPLGFLPCVEVFNPPPGSENLGESDFEALEAQIQAHDEITTGILDNLDFFAYSPLLTSRDPDEVTDATKTSGGMDRDSVAAVSGFGDLPTAFKGGNRARRRSRRLKKVIGNLEPDELFQQLVINPVPSDQIQFVDFYERQLRESLGGILERGIETATESRLVYGKVEVTAREKREALYTYGICKILEMALLAEEAAYVVSKGTTGLPLLGDRTVTYRTAPVFLQTAEDILKRSIVGRNLQEMGYSSKAVLRFVFPDMNESELDKAVGDTGIPFRYLQQTLQAFQQLATIADPATGGVILDPRTGYPLLYTLIPPLLEALNYGQQFNASTQPTSATPTAAESGAIDGAALRFNAGSGAAGATANGVPTDPNQPLDGYASLQLPEPGATVAESRPSAIPDFFNLQRSPILNAIYRR